METGARGLSAPGHTASGAESGLAGEGVTYRFLDCEVDARRLELRRGGEVRHVEPQVFDVLRYLVEHRDRLVSKDELLDAVWGHRFVTPATLNSRIKAVRQATGDDGTAQRVVKTVRGRGFRFVAQAEAVVDSPAGSLGAALGLEAPGGGPVADATAASARRARAPAPPTLAPPADFIARANELDRLEALWASARAGARQVVFLGGESGIGKTTLAEAFLSRVSSEATVARGQCVEHRGAGEAYLPVLDALGRLGRSDARAVVAEHLQRCAPTWLAQLPSLASPEELARAERRSIGVSRERMLREMVEALEAMTREEPLVLLLEDLHWSDPSTLDLVAWIAQRPEPARLLLLGTYRPTDTDVDLRGALGQLRRSRAFSEILLGRWGEEEIRAFCALRYPDCDLPPDLVRLVHRRTGGNPLFIQVLLDAWSESGTLSSGPDEDPTARIEALAADLPETLRTLVEQRVERLSPEEQQVLEAGAVAGLEFTAALVAAALEVGEEEAEALCHGLARRGATLRDAGVVEYGDGTSSAGFAFAHHLFRDALYARVPHLRRKRAHARVGERLEALAGARTSDLANELAMHFRLGRRDLSAIGYLRLSAEQALRRSAHREAATHLEAALDLLTRSQDLAIDSDERLRLELSLQRMLGPSLLFTRGWADPAAERVYARSRQITERLGDREKLAQVLYGMAYLHEIRGDFHLSEPLLQECLHLGEVVRTPYTAIESQELLSCSLFHQGRFADALRSARAALEVFEPLDRGDTFAASLGMNAGVASHYWEGLALWCLGHPDRALDSLAAALQVAGKAQLIYMQASAHHQSAELHHFRRELEPLVRHADAALLISERQGYPYHHAIALTLRGWGRVQEGDVEPGLEAIARGLEMQRAVGADMERPYGLGLYAEALLGAGRADAGLVAVDEALATIERRARAYFWEAELHRLRGELLLALGRRDRAEESLRTALSVAQRQQALSLELRVALSLHRLDGDTEPVARLYQRFGEGFATADLREASALLGRPS